MSSPLQRASPPSAAPAVEENNSSQKTKGKSRLSEKEINRKGYAARCNQKNLPNAASSIALEDKFSWLMHFLCKQADQGKTVSASVEKANGEKLSFTIGHGGGSGPRGRGIPQAGNVFSSSPPMRGGVMQHPFVERHLSQDIVTPARRDAHRDNILSHSQLPESRLPCASLAQGSPDEDVQTAMLTSTSHLTSSDDKVQKLQDALPGVTSHMAADALAKSQGDMDQAAGLLIQHGESSEESTMVLAANGDSPSGSSSSQPGGQPEPKKMTGKRKTKGRKTREKEGEPPPT